MNNSRVALPERIRSVIAGAASRAASRIPAWRNRRSVAFHMAGAPDVDRVAALLEVEKRANTDGGADRPPSSEEVLGGTQRDIVEYHRKLQSRARSKVERLAARLSARARQIDIPESIAGLRDVPSKCRNAIDRVTAEFESGLSLLREQEAHHRLRAEETGEQQAKVHAPGHGASKAIYFALMLAIIGVASLALGSESVWGVASQSLLPADSAIAIAVVTVVLPFLIAAGVSAPAGDHSGRKRPSFWIAIGVTSVYTALLAFFCAHLIAVPAGAADAGNGDVVAAIAAMRTDPGIIAADFNALKGFCIVIAMALLAYLLGSQFVSADGEAGTPRDAYLRARKERDYLTGQLRAHINGIVDKAEKDVTRTSARTRARIKKLGGLVDLATDVESQYGDYLMGLEESCNLLLERYRETNAAARNSDTPPSFAELACFRLDGASRHTMFDDGIARYREIESEMQRYNAAVAQVRQELRDLNRDAIRDLESVEAPADYARDREMPQSAY